MVCLSHRVITITCWLVCHDCELCKKRLNRMSCHLGCGIGWAKERCISWGSKSPCDGTILRGISARLRTCPVVIIIKASQQGQHQYGADANWGVLDEMHIGATCQIRLKHRCVALMQPYVKLFWPRFTCTKLVSAVISCRHVSVCPAVCHKSVFYSNG